MAERTGFEPVIGLLTLWRFSKPLVSATHPPLREWPRTPDVTGAVPKRQTSGRLRRNRWVSAGKAGASAGRRVHGSASRHAGAKGPSRAGRDRSRDRALEVRLHTYHHRRADGRAASLHELLAGGNLDGPTLREMGTDAVPSFPAFPLASPRRSGGGAANRRYPNPLPGRLLSRRSLARLDLPRRRRDSRRDAPLGHPKVPSLSQGRPVQPGSSGGDGA